MKKSIFISLCVILMTVTDCFAGIGGYSWSENSKYYSTDIPIVFGGTTLSTTYSQAAMTSINAWSGVNGISINITANSTNKFYVQSYTDSWFGLTTMWTSGENMTKFEIDINSRTIHQSFSANEYKAAKSVFAHELGHVLGLDDLPGNENVNTSIMKNNRDRTIVYSPTGLDTYRVRILYGLI